MAAYSAGQIAGLVFGLIIVAAIIYKVVASKK